MATYGKEYSYNPPRRRKQKYSLIQRVIDFAVAPITGGQYGESGKSTTAWAAGDVIKAIQIHAGQTVLGVQVQIIKRSGTANTVLKVGYGSDIDKWGRYNFGTEKSGIELTHSYPMTTDKAVMPDQFMEPMYFATADTIDIVISQAITDGKVRLIVHLLEDDR